MSERIEPGTLYVVSTPIGNLEDISSRGAKVLAGVDLIAAEDTRTTGVLLKHLGISKPQVSFHAHNEHRKVAGLVARLKEGGSVALVSDAGTPGISDPAYSVVRSALAEGVRVVAIPGASALLAALVVSGMPMDRFAFEGFLPVKKGRETRLGHLADEDRTTILYEAPHRLLRTLEDLLRVCGDREVAVSRELTKRFEEVRRGTLTQMLVHFRDHNPRGEFVIVMSGIKRGNNRHVGVGMPTEVEDGNEEGTEAG
jgi:16S rRNA (cytidine1402-2'-O)-methyltransferase